MKIGYLKNSAEGVSWLLDPKGTLFLAREMVEFGPPRLTVLHYLSTDILITPKNVSVVFCLGFLCAIVYALYNSVCFPCLAKQKKITEYGCNCLVDL
jgi:hypothetical protein